MRWAERYVGLPFADGGRDIDGLDCWGLVRLVLKEQKSIDVPSYGEISAADLMKVARTIGRECLADPWKTVSVPHAFDVVVMSSPRVAGRSVSHCGIMVDERRFLHVEQHTHSVLVPITHPTVRNRIRGYYRHRDA